jgi:hypothetical protein
MERTVTPAELRLSSCIAQYINQGNPSQVARDARADRLAKFLTQPADYIPTKYVVWWLLIAFLLGTQWRVILAVLSTLGVPGPL